MEWTKQQKAGFILCQDVLNKVGLKNIEVAEMFSTFETKEDVFTAFEFQTGKWLNDKKVNQIVEKIYIKKRG